MKLKSIRHPSTMKLLYLGILLVGFQTDCIESCETGYYSLNGNCQACPKNCATCETGSLCTICNAGYFGGNCSYNCPSLCHNNECNQIFGDCLSCKQGYFIDVNKTCKQCPDNCITCESEHVCFACRNGYKGEHCQDVCSSCKTGTSCDKKTGYCFNDCIDGLSGELCDKSCDSKCRLCNRYKQNECNTCAPDRFGVSCNQQCSNACVANACDNVTGICTFGCKNGFWGDLCDKKCSLECRNNVCNEKDGTCKGECVEENNCKPSYGTDSGINPGVIGAISGFVSFVIIIAVTVLIACFVYRRKRESRQAKCSNSCISKIENPNANNLSAEDVGLPLMNIESEQKNEELNLIVPNEGNININDKPTTTSIKVTELAKYVTHKPTSTFYTEFQRLSKDVSGTKQSGSVTSRTQTKVPQIGLPVVLYEPCKAPVSINANFIGGGSNDSKAYIAYMGSAGMSRNDIEVFWKIVWQERCGTVVMLGTPLPEEKCTCTCKSALCSVEYNDLTVVCHGEIKMASFTVKKYILKRHMMEEREVQRLQFSEAPSYQLPEVSSFVEFVNYANKIKVLNGPTMVYCRCGTECTGTYIALDILTKQGKDTGWVDIQSCVGHLLEQRVNMLHTYKQYEFLHQALVCSLKSEYDIETEV